MEHYHLPIIPYLSQYPFLFYQSWNQANHFCSVRVITPSKQAETRESLEEAPKALNQQTERVAQNEPIVKPTKSNKAMQKEKLKKKKEREDDYQRKKQKKDRNLPSNIFKHLASFFYLNPNIIQDIHKSIPANLTVSSSELVQKFKKAVKFGQSYIRPFLVQSLCKQGTFSSDEALVFRIVLRKFLLFDMPVFIMNQPKLKRKQRGDYIKMGRKIFGQIKKGFFNE